jgi:hypothetical protein
MKANKSNECNQRMYHDLMDQHEKELLCLLFIPSDNIKAKEASLAYLIYRIVSLH